MRNLIGFLVLAVTMIAVYATSARADIPLVTPGTLPRVSGEMRGTLCIVAGDTTTKFVSMTGVAFSQTMHGDIIVRTSAWGTVFTDEIVGSLPAGTNAIGTVLVDVDLLTDTEAQNPAEAIYTAGDVVGGCFEIPNAVPAAAGSGEIVEVMLVDSENLQATLDAQVIYFKEFAGVPADNAALALSATATGTIIGSASLNDADTFVVNHSLGTSGIMVNRFGGSGLHFTADTGQTSIWAVIIAGGAVDYTGAAQTLTITNVVRRKP